MIVLCLCGLEYGIKSTYSQTVPIASRIKTRVLDSDSNDAFPCLSSGSRVLELSMCARDLMLRLPSNACVGL
jgi:hypothetical protein